MFTERMEVANHQQLSLFTNKNGRFRAFIALHDLTLGPGMGGVRRWAYRTEEQAVTDVLRLSEAMSYKAAVAGLPFGGAKAVIWCPPNAVPSPTEAYEFGMCVAAMGGRYIAAPDVGTNEQYMDWMAAASKYVAGRPVESGGSGSPSPATARGVFAGILATIRRLEGHDSLTGKVIAVQGAGSVGSHLVELLVAHGARVLLADVATDRVKALSEQFGAAVTPYPADDILTAPCDVLAPCALGGVLHEAIISQLRCRIVAGSANNPLQYPLDDSEHLAERSILYAPDFVINAGGLIHIAGHWLGWSAVDTEHRISEIGENLGEIFAQAGSSGNTHAEALKQAQARLMAPISQIEHRQFMASAN